MRDLQTVTRRAVRPARAVERWYRARRSGIPARLGDLRRTTPINENWGRGRGRPIDRVYIERFLSHHRADIRGHALEVENDRYVRGFGTGVTAVDVLHADEGNPRATMVANLESGAGIPDGTFDCAVVTQVLQYVYELRDALGTLRRILAPGGVLLATVPGITRISRDESEAYGEWWRLTAQSARRLAGEAFGEANVRVETYGNVLAAAAVLYGLGSADLRAAELEVNDPLFPVVVGIRAEKAR